MRAQAQARSAKVAGSKAELKERKDGCAKGCGWFRKPEHRRNFYRIAIAGKIEVFEDLARLSKLGKPELGGVSR